MPNNSKLFLLIVYHIATIALFHVVFNTSHLPSDIINILFFNALITFIGITTFKFFKPENDYANDNKFLGITSIVAISCLVFTIFSHAVSQNGGNIGELVYYSIFNYTLDIPLKNDDSCLIICLDKSESGKKRIENPKLIQQYNEKIVDLYDDLNLEASRFQYNQNTSVFDIFLMRALEALSSEKGKQNLQNVRMVTFGTNAPEWVDNKTVHELAKQITEFKPDNKNTDFKYLFNRLNKIVDEQYDKYIHKNFKILILSDFIQDVAGDKSLNTDIESEYRKLLKKSAHLNFSVISTSDSIIERAPILRFMNQELKILGLSCNILDNTHRYRDIPNYFVESRKLKFYYDKAFFAESSSKITFNSVSDADFVGFSYLKTSNLTPQSLSYQTSEDNKEDWKIIWPNEILQSKSNGELHLKYKGPIQPISPKIEFAIFDESETFKICEGDCAFIQKVPKIVAILLLILLVILLIFETIFIVQSSAEDV